MSTAQAETDRTITTDIPARLDRLPWSRKADPVVEPAEAA